MNKRQQFYEFGPFRIDPGRRLLLRDSQPVPVQPKAFDILLALVENKEKVVLKDELMRTVWPETFVEESNLAQHIFVLRKALGDVVGENRYIVTIPGRGYRFTGQVNTIPAVAGQEDEIEVRSRSLSRVVINETVPARTLALTGDRSRMRRAIFYVALVIAVVAAVLFRPYVPPPRVWRIRQLTHLGTLVYNTAVVTDGPRIYFRAWMAGGKRVIRYVSPEGGEVFPVEDPLPAMDINDISPSGAEFLINNLSDSDGSTESDNYAFWRAPVSPGSPRPLGVRAGNARWSPDGSTIVFTHDSSLYLVNSDGTNSRKLTATPGYALSPSWSPDGQRIRFSVADPQGRGLALWQANVATRTVRPVLPDWPVSARQRSGPWSPDGRYYFFTGLGEENRDIWAMREPQGTLRRVNSRPVRLTAGPLNFYQLTPSKDGKSIFVIGQQVRGQLVRFDRVSRQYLLYAKGISADHVAFSRDGQWVAYVEYPARVLIRARIDGSERRQLTFPPMRVSHPQWSPDGTQLAFQGAADLASPSRIYIVSRDGGRPVLATPERNDLVLGSDFPGWPPCGGPDRSPSEIDAVRHDFS